MKGELFVQRASIRRFKQDAVPEEAIQALLKAAIEAPSAGNCQPWHFYVVRNGERKQKLCADAYNQRFIAEAPLVIVVCAELERSAARYGERGTELYCLQDTAAAIENMLLCAVEHGLGACWCGAFDDAAVGRTLALPKNRRPVAILPVGYPAGAGKKPARRAMKETVTFID